MIALTVALAALVGVSLGLLGGGGSVLAVPLLVYVAGLDAQHAVATSLFVVGTTSAAGLVPHARAGRIRWRTGALFGAAGMLGAYAGGRIAGHVPGVILLGAFAAMMIVTASAMIRGRRALSGAEASGARAWFRMGGTGFVVGALTGFVGAGGGFLIVPALVLLGGVPMAEAVGTSLLVIILQSTAGFAGHLAGVRLDWPLALGVAASAIVGSLVGAGFTGRIGQEQLRRGFGWFVLAMGLLVMAQQLPGALAAWATLAVGLAGAVAVGIAFGTRGVRSRTQRGASEGSPPGGSGAPTVPPARLSSHPHIGATQARE